MKRNRLDPAVRTRQLMDAALKLAISHNGGYRAVTREAIADAAKVSPALVSLHLGTMDAVRRGIMRAAIDSSCLRVIAQGLAVGDRHAKKAPEELRRQASQFLAGC